MIGVSISRSPSYPSPITGSWYTDVSGAGRRFPLPLLRLGRGSNGRHSVWRCRSCGGNPVSPSGDNDSKAVLDAFFLGKAFAEALNERVGFAVGEALSVLGQWQAEQQKQVQEFQEDVVVRAKKAQAKAAVDAMAQQGITPKPLVVPPPLSDPANENPLDEMLRE